MSFAASYSHQAFLPVATLAGKNQMVRDPFQAGVGATSLAATLTLGVNCP